MTQTKIGVGMISATSIGDAKVLQGDGSWVTPSAGALTFISNTDISAAATYDFESFTAGSYEHYLFVLQNIIPATDAVHLHCLTSTDGGSSYDTGGSDYRWGVSVVATWDEAGANAYIALTGDAANTSMQVGSSSTESGVNGTVWLHGPHTTSFTAVSCSLSYANAGGVWAMSQGGGSRETAADVDGFRFLFSSGNIESGTITAYGLANS